MADISKTKTFNADALRRRVGAMKLGDEFTVESKAEQKVAWNCGRELRLAGKIKFAVETRLRENGTYSVRAVKP